MLNIRYCWILCFTSIAFIVLNFQASYSTNKFDIQILQVTPITENLEETAPILNSNMTNLGSEEAKLIPDLFIKVEDKGDFFKNKLIKNITNSGFNLINNETKKYGNNEYLLMEVNDTATVLKLKEYLDMSNLNLTSSVLHEAEPF
jgi:hypothetical protein